jgi:anti-sigma regulatory factor (Ser/Thr protein kinase)
MIEKTVIIANDLEEITRLSTEFETFAEEQDIAMKAIFEINISLDEILTNIISYGYKDGGKHEIFLRFCYTAPEITITIQDDGTPFNPLNVPPPDLTTSLEDKPIGGLGMHLVRKMMDDVSYMYHDEKNCLHLKKKV